MGKKSKFNQNHNLVALTDNFGKKLTPDSKPKSKAEKAKPEKVVAVDSDVSTVSTSSGVLTVKAEPINDNVENAKSFDEEVKIDDDKKNGIEMDNADQEDDDFIKPTRKGKRNSEDKAKNNKSSNDTPVRTEVPDSKRRHSESKSGKFNKPENNKSDYKKRDGGHRERGDYNKDHNRDYNKDYSKNYNKNHNKDYNKDQNKEYKLNYEEISGDLFEAPEDYSLAHCVGEDMMMNAGIAVTFRKQFKHYGDLLDQKKVTGEVAVLENGKRFIYYLVTKRRSQGKPTLESLKSSLVQMRNHVEAHDIKKIAMPKIGCGLDRLVWDEVRDSIKSIFGYLDISIVVYDFVKVDDPSKPNFVRGAFIKHNNHSIGSLDSKGTTYLYLASQSNRITEEIKKLDNKFRFLSSISVENIQLGEIVKARVGVDIYALVCKDRNDELSFKALENCLRNLSKHKIFYIGLEVDKDIVRDEVMMKKFEGVFKFTVNTNIEVHFCSSEFSEQYMGRTRSPYRNQ